MTIDLAQLSIYYVMLLPAIAAFIAGMIRQDKLPQLANSSIALVVMIALAALQALLGGKIGGSPLADFGIVVAYTVGLAHTPPFASLQQYLQTNVLSLGSGGKPASTTSAQQEGTTHNLDPQILAQQILQYINMPQLAALLKDELMKLSAPPQQPSQRDIPTRPDQGIVRANTPPPSNVNWPSVSTQKHGG